MAIVKRFKLRTHPKTITFYEGDLIVNIDALGREKLHLCVGDVIELSPYIDNGHTPQAGLFLQIEAVPQEIQSKGGPISVSRDIAAAFGLEGVREVCVRRVEREEVGLDLVELRIKFTGLLLITNSDYREEDQCLTHSDMWRFTSSLAEYFVHTGKKLDHAGMRVTVSRLWSKLGAVVSSGAILSQTRVIFRSASVQLFLYLQISEEMWHFDPSGDLYFDKAVGGFLRELFEHWREEGCNHEVTLLFCWRAFYDKAAMEKLSDDVKSSIQTDKKGRKYEDFYKVIAGGESLGDWNSKLVDIKRAFAHLKASLVEERGEGVELSTAHEGNVLEAINLAMNVFQKHYTDCSFSMTGHQVIIVTAGAGMFEVDHELTRLTNERIISGGVATDLVCLTDQPLHAVPLLKFQDVQDNSDYYHIPHWINYSFYSPSHSRHWAGFQPRLKLSDHLVNTALSRGNRRFKGDQLYNPFTVIRKNSPGSRTRALHDRLLHRVDYDEYDAFVFSKTPNVVVKPQPTRTGHPRPARVKRFRYHSTGESAPRYTPPSLPRELDDPFDDDIESPSQSPDTRGVQSAKEIQMTTSFDVGSFRTRYPTDETVVDSSVKSGHGHLGGSAESLHHFKPPDITPRKSKSLINPFNPQLQTSDQTAYHRRWAHVFPRDKEGVAFQVHHVIEEESCDRQRSYSRGSVVSSRRLSEEQSLASSSGLWMKKTDSLHLQEDHYSDPKRSPSLNVRGRGNSSIMSSSKDRSPQLSIRGIDITTISKLPSENFASARRLGADWRSLTEPACLPITTDYFPGQEKLTNEFFEYHTTMVAYTYNAYHSEETLAERNIPAWISDHQSVSTLQVFSEMISQRISQGFQLVFEPQSGHGESQETIFFLRQALTQLQKEVTSNKKRRRLREITVKLSLGRVFQQMKLRYPDILVWIYRPKTQMMTQPISCTYQLSTTMESKFTDQKVEFSHTHTAEYNWNYLDQHICGYPDFEELGESQKYWRCRFLLLPSGSNLSSLEGVARWTALIANFVRFIEFLNHVKRNSGTRSKPGSKQSGQGSLKRQMSLPATSVDSHSTLQSPRPPHRLVDIHENKPPMSPRSDRQRGPEEGIKISEFLTNRPNSPYLASSQPKSADSRRMLTSNAAGSDKADSPRRHRRTSSHDLNAQRSKDIVAKAKIRGSPQLLRRTRDAGQTQDSNGSKITSPSRKSRKKATEGGATVEVTPLTPTADESVTSVTSDSVTGGTSVESFLQVPLLNSSSPVQLIAKAMAHSEEGIDFLGHLPGLKNCCFVAMEAVSWVVDKISGVNTRREAVKILQSMMSEELVVHASGDVNIPFIDGYFLYQLPLKESQDSTDTQRSDKDSVDRSFVLVEPMDYEKFTKRWFEVRVHYPMASSENSTLLSVGTSPSLASTFPASFQRSGASFYMHFEGREDAQIPESFSNRFVELNPDPQTRSDRPEWCYVRYDHTYRPQCAFQLELQWMVATMNLLNQLIQNWVTKATMCGFNLFPAPMLSSLTTSSYPFTQNQFIPLTLPPAFPDCSSDTTPLNKLFNSLLTKFSFLLDPATLPQSSDVLSALYDTGDFTSRLFVHTSGVAFVQPYTDQDQSDLRTLSHDQPKGAVDIERSSLRRQFSAPIGSSTPLTGSPSNDPRMPPYEIVKGHPKCGFYWYKNHLLLRQNATYQEEHEKVLNQLVEFCSDVKGELTKLCNLIDCLTILN